MTPAEAIAACRASPMVPLVPVAADVLGIGHNLAYQLAKAGEFPVRVLRLGRLLRVPSAELLALLGVDKDGLHRE